MIKKEEKTIYNKNLRILTLVALPAILTLSFAPTVLASSNQLSEAESKMDYLRKTEEIFKKVASDFLVWGLDFLSVRYMKKKDKDTLLRNASSLETKTEKLAEKVTNLQPPASYQDYHAKIVNFIVSWRFATQLWKKMIEGLNPENIGSESTTVKTGRKVQDLLTKKLEEVNEVLEEIS